MSLDRQKFLLTLKEIIYARITNSYIVYKLRLYIDLIVHILFSFLYEFIYGHRKLSFSSSQ